MKSNDFESLIRDAAQGLFDGKPISITLLERIYSESATILGRNSYEAILADTRKFVEKIFENGNIEFYQVARGGKSKESPEDWIKKVLYPLAYEDMRVDRGSGIPLLTLSVYRDGKNDIPELRRFYDSLAYHRRSQDRGETIHARRYTRNG